MTAARRWALSVMALIATLMQSIDTTIANVALPHMQAALGAAPDTITWVLTSYMIAAAVATPMAGWLESKLGRRLLFTIATLGFTLASGLCGAAPSLTLMVVARILQGLFGAMLLPLSQALLLDIYPQEKRAAAMTVWSMGVMISPIFGPVLGGWLTDNFSWRWVFYVNVPAGLIASITLWLLLDEGKKASRRFDLLGFSLLALTVASIQLMLDRGTQKDWFDSPEIVIEAGVAIAAAWMFVVHSFTAAHPLLPRAIFRDRNFTACIVVSFFVVAAMFSSQALIAPMLQQLMSYDTQQAGWALMPRGLATMFAMMIAGRLIGRVDTRFLMGFGLVTIAAAQWMMTGFELGMDSWPVVASGLMQGAGMGFVFIPLTVVGYATLPEHLRTDAAALYSLMRNFSASAGIAIMGALVARNSQIIHSELGAHVTESSMPVVGDRFLSTMGHLREGIATMIDLEVNRQALMIAYLNDFWLLMWGAMLLFPLVFLLKPPRRKDEEQVVSGE